MSNVEDLCAKDPTITEVQLKGSGTLADYPADFVDRYLRTDIREKVDFEICNQ